MNKHRVFLADDHEMIREGLKMLVNSQQDMETVGESDNGRSTITLVKKLNPDIVVMDISMPELNGLKTTEKLQKISPGVKILILTRHTDLAYIKQLFSAGASGYILKKSASAELMGAIRRVVSGKMYIDPQIADKVVQGFTYKRNERNNESNAELGSREEEVLRLIAWGLTNKEIAEKLSISVKTVESHKARALEKLNMKSRVDIVRYALLKDWLQDL